MNAKYEKASLPGSNDQLLAMAAEREVWADTARRQDMHRTAEELELTALLLREAYKLEEALDHIRSLLVVLRQQDDENEKIPMSPFGRAQAFYNKCRPEQSVVSEIREYLRLKG